MPTVGARAEHCTIYGRCSTTPQGIPGQVFTCYLSTETDLTLVFFFCIVLFCFFRFGLCCFDLPLRQVISRLLISKQWSAMRSIRSMHAVI